jgi:poly-gamma-glutamate system protein
MKEDRWYRPVSGSRPAARGLLIALGVAIALLTASRFALVRSDGPHITILPLVHESRMSSDLARKADSAVALVIRAQDFMRAARQAEGIEAGPGARPDMSGMIGDELTSLMTTLGALEAKRVSTNPEWARVLTVEMDRAGVGEGGVVAAGFSGSFPALNLAVIAACQAVQADLVAVSSVTASSWGANQPGFTWPEMEARLVRAGIIHRASIAVSMGGSGDRALDLEPEGQALAQRIQEQSAADLGVIALHPASLSDSIEQRLDLYRRAARSRRVVLYVSVGGADASLGRSSAILRLRSGLIPAVPFDFSPSRGLIARYAERGVPVLILLNVRDLAARWGVPLAPRAF